MSGLATSCVGISSGWRAGENACEVVCEDGTIILNQGDGPSTNIPWPPGAIQLKWFLQRAGQWTISDLPPVKSQGDRIAGLAGPIAQFLHAAREAIATAEDGCNALRLVLACYQSAEQGRRISL